MSIFLVSTDKMATLEDGSKTITLANSFMVELTPELEEKITKEVFEKYNHEKLFDYKEFADLSALARINLQAHDWEVGEIVHEVFQKLRSLV